MGALKTANLNHLINELEKINDSINKIDLSLKDIEKELIESIWVGGKFNKLELENKQKEIKVQLDSLEKQYFSNKKKLRFKEKRDYFKKVKLIHEKIVLVDYFRDMLVHRGKALEEIVANYSKIHVENLAFELIFNEKQDLLLWLSNFNIKLEIEKEVIFLFNFHIVNEVTTRRDSFDKSLLVSTKKATKIKYEHIISSLSLLSIALFLSETIINWYFVNTIAHYLLINYIMTVVAIFSSSICFADFAKQDIELFNIDEKNPIDKITKRQSSIKYIADILFYLGINFVFLAIKFRNLFVKEVIIIIIRLKITFELLPVIHALVGFSLIFIAVCLFFKNLSISKENPNSLINNKFLLSPIYYFMIVGGESVISYLMIVIWIYSIISLLMKKEIKNKKIREIWNLRKRYTNDFYSSFRKAKNYKDILVQNLPGFWWLILFTLTLLDTLTVIPLTLFTIMLFGIYFYKNVKIRKSIIISLNIILIIIGISATLYLIHLINYTWILYTIIEVDYLYIFNYRIDFTTLYCVVVCLVFYLIFTFYNIAVYRMKNILYKFILTIRSWGALSYISFLSLLFIINYPEFYLYIVIFSLIAFVCVNIVIYLSYSKKLLQYLIELAGKHTISLSILLDYNFTKFNISYLGVKRLNKKNITIT